MKRTRKSPAVTGKAAEAMAPPPTEEDAARAILPVLDRLLTRLRGKAGQSWGARGSFIGSAINQAMLTLARDLNARMDEAFVMRDAVFLELQVILEDTTYLGQPGALHDLQIIRRQMACLARLPEESDVKPPGARESNQAGKVPAVPRLYVRMDVQPPDIVLDGVSYPAPEVSVAFLGRLIKADGEAVSVAGFLEEHSDYAGTNRTRVVDRLPKPILEFIDRPGMGSPPRLLVEKLL